MNYNQNLPDYTHDMYLRGFNPYEILEALRRTKRKKKKEESILEKEIFNFIEGMATAAINGAIDEIFKEWK